MNRTMKRTLWACFLFLTILLNSLNLHIVTAAPPEPTPEGQPVPAAAIRKVYIPLLQNPAKAIQPPSSGWWKPAMNTTMQFQLTYLHNNGKVVDTSFDVNLYVLDLFDTPETAITTLHSQGRKVMCYTSIGTFEGWREDAGKYPESVKGKSNGWHDEYWVDIRQRDVLAPIFRARMDLCKAKGFDGVVPDNLSGFMNDTGFNITAQQQIDFNRWFAGEAHQRGLTAGLQNDPDQAKFLADVYDFGVTEDCLNMDYCYMEKPFLDAGKPVFNMEYTDQMSETHFLNDQSACPSSSSQRIASILKNRNLDAYRLPCSGK